MSTKPGRNDPCYCGSGKKYKKCHLPIDQQAEKEKRAQAAAARYIRRDLLKFARDEQFAEDFAQALALYWDGYYDVETAESMSQPEAMRFFDWFTFDYTLADGRRLIDVYVAERYEDLSTPQQQVIGEWKDAPPASAYELTGYEGQTLQLRDYLTGEEVELFEPGGRGNVQIGEVILARLVPVTGHLEFSTSVAYLPAAEIADLKEKMEAAKAEYLAEHPDGAHADFLRDRNYLMVHHGLAQAKAQGRPPVARLDPDRPDKKTQKIAQGMKRFRR